MFGVDRLVVRVHVKEQQCKHTSLWKAIFLSAPSAALAVEDHKKNRQLDSNVWMSPVSLTSFVSSKIFLGRILWFTVS